MAKVSFWKDRRHSSQEWHVGAVQQRVFKLEHPVTTRSKQYCHNRDGAVDHQDWDQGKVALDKRRQRNYRSRDHISTRVSMGSRSRPQSRTQKEHTKQDAPKWDAMVAMCDKANDPKCKRTTVESNTL